MSYLMRSVVNSWGQNTCTTSTCSMVGFTTRRANMVCLERCECKVSIYKMKEWNRMFDTSKIGYSFPPFTVAIEHTKMRELALALGEGNPVYQSRQAAQA